MNNDEKVSTIETNENISEKVDFDFFYYHLKHGYSMCWKSGDNGYNLPMYHTYVDMAQLDVIKDRLKDWWNKNVDKFNDDEFWKGDNSEMHNLTTLLYGEYGFLIDDDRNININKWKDLCRGKIDDEVLILHTPKSKYKKILEYSVYPLGAALIAWVVGRIVYK